MYVLTKSRAQQRRPVAVSWRHPAWLWESPSFSGQTRSNLLRDSPGQRHTRLLKLMVRASVMPISLTPIKIRRLRCTGIHSIVTPSSFIINVNKLLLLIIMLLLAGRKDKQEHKLEFLPLVTLLCFCSAVEGIKNSSSSSQIQRTKIRQPKNQRTGD